MSGSAKKLLHAAAGSASGDPVYVEDVFSTHLYTGNSSTRSIDNNIDLSGEGGLVWIKDRSAAEEHVLIDSERGASKGIRSNSNAAEHTDTSSLTSFDNDGFSLGTGYSYFSTNYTGRDYASWTFRKQEGFFDIVTYTGDGSTNKTINHNLNCKPGMMIIKMLTESGYAWRVWHKSVASSNGANYSLSLNNTTAAANGSSSAGGYWNHTAPTSTQFTVGDYGQTNNNGSSFVAYLFADGDESDAQIFGEDGDEAIIKCGSYQSDGNGNEVFVDLGFEPQWVMIKSSTDTQSWIIQDNMRGMAHSTSTNNYLLANSSGAENSEGTAGMVRAESNGMTIGVAGIINYFNSVQTYTYVAIRRGPMKEPSAGTDVLDLSTGDNNAGNNAGFPVDFILRKRTDLDGDNEVYTRLTGEKYLDTNKTTAASSATVGFDHMTTFNGSGWGTGFDFYNWRRYPKVFDVVVYKAQTGGGLVSGDGTKSVVRHNLGAVPEIIIGKDIDDVGANWAVVWLSEGNGGSKRLNDISESYGSTTVLNSTDPTATQVTVSGSLNGYGQNNLLLLFASLDGICKCGTYEGTGNAINVDCGFAARFVLITGVESGLTANYPFYVYDTGRGIVSGNDPYFDLSSSDVEVTNTDYIDPHSSGFTITSSAPASLNTNNYTYGFLAFA
jgi:hypothetical protein